MVGSKIASISLLLFLSLGCSVSWYSTDQHPTLHRERVTHPAARCRNEARVEFAVSNPLDRSYEGTLLCEQIYTSDLHFRDIMVSPWSDLRVFIDLPRQASFSCWVERVIPPFIPEKPSRISFYLE